ncbi:hypothetical protein L596_013420 [Steinernema carpocapsae]|uniref:Uncharacterized protein n=2 Tax=Steinernema carpocapsae TaxID=34508 RepID=A0A4U5P0Z3_STECR|nr:hypothetical protein L596_013420 [Steinernema carpocapsae]
MKVLKDSTENLVTHYHTYAIIICLRIQAKTYSSYFRLKMSQPRHCADLRILFEFCLCPVAFEEPLETNSANAKILADGLIASLQQTIDEANAAHLCTPRTVLYERTVTRK